MTDKEPHWLLDFASNTYSQCGEDGIIEKILSLLPERDRHCVEFGAWDGKYLSNVRRLIEEEDYAAVYIEGSRERFEELKANYRENPKVTPLNAFVGFDKETGLDTLLEGTGIPLDFDFLCIDIDGNDFHVWNAVEKYRPKVVAIEFNPTIPTEVDFVQPAKMKVSQGSSLAAMCRLAAEKGYELVCVQPFNAFFVEKKYFPLYGIEDNRPQTLRRDLSLVTWFFIGYDGTLHFTGSKLLHWHEMDLYDGELQVLPRALRRFPENYTKLQHLGLRIWKRWRFIRRFKKWSP